MPHPGPLTTTVESPFANAFDVANLIDTTPIHLWNARLNSTYGFGFDSDAEILAEHTGRLPADIALLTMVFSMSSAALGCSGTPGRFTVRSMIHLLQIRSRADIMSIIGTLSIWESLAENGFRCPA